MRVVNKIVFAVAVDVLSDDSFRDVSRLQNASRQQSNKPSTMLIEDHVALKEATAVLDGIVLESMFRLKRCAEMVYD